MKTIAVAVTMPDASDAGFGVWLVKEDRSGVYLTSFTTVEGADIMCTTLASEMGVPARTRAKSKLLSVAS